ncbi:MAG TPA: hypothetical protein VHF89_13900 [Solirubrobacteraceae bacterium]|nr:hypothetical protein [Solirubrobacteraceae bacterium]
MDRNPSRVAAVNESGRDAVCADARSLDVEDVVRFVSMSDFLEHLPHLKAVRSVIGSAARAATDFLYIFHPSFEGKELAAAAGFKQYWWDWRVHTAHIRIDDYCQMFDQLGLRRYCIRYVKPVVDSGHPSVLPIDAPPDQSAYDEARHGPKERVEFAHPLWRAQEIFVALRDLPAEEWQRITEPWKKTPLRELVETRRA